jgi:hypothetical protein
MFLESFHRFGNVIFRRVRIDRAEAQHHLPAQLRGQDQRVALLCIRVAIGPQNHWSGFTARQGLACNYWT